MKEKFIFGEGKKNQISWKTHFWKNNFKEQQILRGASEVEGVEKTCMCN